MKQPLPFKGICSGKELIQSSCRFASDPLNNQQKIRPLFDFSVLSWILLESLDQYQEGYALLLPVIFILRLMIVMSVGFTEDLFFIPFFLLCKKASLLFTHMVMEVFVLYF